MKKLVKNFVLIVAMIAVSCVADTTEDLSVVNGGQVTKITLSLEGSRTELGADADGVYPLYWSEGDQISVNGVASAALTATQAGSSAATFSVSGSLAAPYAIAYPAAAVGQVLFAENQTHVGNTTFGSGVSTMYAYGDSNGVQLSHLTGVLKIGVVGSATIAKAQISTIDRAPIAGAFAIDFATGAVSATAESKHVINYSFGEGAQLSSEATYLHVAVPAGVYDELYVTLFDAEGGAMYAVVKANDTKPLAAGKVRDFKNSISYTPLSNATVISNADQLIAWGASAATSSADVILVNDIDMTGKEWTEVDGFLGGFNGNGYAIKGLTRPLFGTTKAKFIKGVHLVDVNIVESANPVVGCLADVVDNASSVIENCSASGTLRVQDSYTVASYTAGLIGQALTKETISGMVNKVNVDFAANTTKAGYYCGCFARADGDVIDCHNLGAITISGVMKGRVWLNGVGGYLLGVVSQCTNGSKDDASLGAVTFVGENNSANDLRMSGITACGAKGVSHCINYGKIEASGKLTQVNNLLVMGIHMQSNNVVGPFTDCVNYGHLLIKPTSTPATTKITTAYMGGISNSYNKACTLYARNVNYGKVEYAAEVQTATKLEMGGILSSLTLYPVEDVTNYGEIVVAGSVTGDCNVGGIAGYTTGGIFSGEIINEGAISVSGKSANLYLGGVLGKWSTAATATNAKMANTAKINYVGTTTTALKVGGLFGELAIAAPCSSLVNTGDINCAGTNNSSVASLYVGGVVGTTSVGVANAKSYCNIVVPDGSAVGAIMGSSRADNIIASNCELGGAIAFSTQTVEDSEGDTEVCPVYQTLAPENYFNYIYGGTTQWAEGSNYDGCTFLSAKPTI